MVYIQTHHILISMDFTTFVFSDLFAFSFQYLIVMLCDAWCYECMLVCECVCRSAVSFTGSVKFYLLGVGESFPVHRYSFYHALCHLLLVNANTHTHTHTLANKPQIISAYLFAKITNCCYLSKVFPMDLIV